MTYIPSEIKPLPTEVVREVTKIVTSELVKTQLLNEDGTVSEESQKKYGFETEMALPTSGIMVKGSMDDCDICERNVQEANSLELENKRLQNELLKRQIDLLEKSQEYRCCPNESEEIP